MHKHGNDVAHKYLIIDMSEMLELCSDGETNTTQELHIIKSVDGTLVVYVFLSSDIPFSIPSDIPPPVPLMLHSLLVSVQHSTTLKPPHEHQEFLSIRCHYRKEDIWPTSSCGFLSRRLCSCIGHVRFKCIITTSKPESRLFYL